MTTPGADDREPDGRAARHLPLAGSLVREVLRRTPAQLVEDDLYAAAVIALADADAEFDPVHDAPYERYVTARIRQGMFEELHSLDWSSYDAQAADDRHAAARARIDAVLIRLGEREPGLAALTGETAAELATPDHDDTDLPYLDAAIAELPATDDVHAMRAEAVALLRASLMAQHRVETRALEGLDAVAAAVRASRLSFGSGRAELDVVEQVAPDHTSAADRTA